MSKILSKTVKKGMLMTVLVTVVLALALVIGGIFGFNNSIKDVNTLTVSVDNYAYETSLDDIEAECGKVFKSLSIKAKSEVKGEMSSALASEIMYVFDKSVDVEKAEAALESAFAAKTVDGGEWAGMELTVNSGSENVVGTTAKYYALRGGLATLAFLLITFGYVTLRYKFNVGVFTTGATLVGMLLTTAIIVLTRIPVTPAVAYAIVASGMLTAVAVLFNFNKLRAALKEEDAAEKSLQETIVSSIAVKETLFLAASLTIALALLAIFGKASIALFSLSAFVAVLVATFMGILFAPAAYLPVKAYADKVAESKSKSYKGAKKTSVKKEKIVDETTPVEVAPAPATEEPVEETEEIVEETSAEEAEETATQDEE